MHGAHPWLVVAATVAAVAGCAVAEEGPLTASATLVLDRETLPFSAPLAVTYTFAVAPGAPPVAGDYRVRVWFRSQDGALLWSDDHAPPTPVAEWAPGTTVTYTRERFLPRVPYIGPVAIDVAIESAATGARLRLDAAAGAEPRAYRLGALDIRPQTAPLEFGDGWYPRESGEAPLETWRWSSGEGRVRFSNPWGDAVLYLDVDQPVGSLTGPQQVEIWLGERLLRAFEVTGPRVTVRTTIASDAFGLQVAGELVFRVSPAFVPSALEALPGSTDDRVLGVRVFHAILLPS